MIFKSCEHPGESHAKHLTNRSSRPLAVVLKAEGSIMKDEMKAKLAAASRGL